MVLYRYYRNFFRIFYNIKIIIILNKIEVIRTYGKILYKSINDVALQRIAQRSGKERAPYEKKEGLVQIKDVYEELISKEDYPIVRINADLSEREVTKEALDNVLW